MSWQDAPIADLHTGKLGEQLLKLPLIALQLGHSNLEDTERYCHAETPEARFVADLLDLAKGRGRGISTSEMADRWYGGVSAALDLLATIWNAHDAAHEDPHVA